jgi:hypothetical protein
MKSHAFMTKFSVFIAFGLSIIPTVELARGDQGRPAAGDQRKKRRLVTGVFMASCPL